MIISDTIASLTLAVAISAASTPAIIDFVDEHRGLLNNISNPTEAQISESCAGDQKCRSDLLYSASQLKEALAMYDDSVKVHATITRVQAANHEDQE